MDHLGKVFIFQPDPKLYTLQMYIYSLPTISCTVLSTRNTAVGKTGSLLEGALHSGWENWDGAQAIAAEVQ